ncbi:hypothetical protein G647_00418 [Cladophialophora carrionii CBS 160.54]|uniref:DUF6594 domain-containing protein n=1 Tax=Cladophialophora carrionii CBS 160.54 TaxID=1279043 RepID=V9DM35_9EURO|nr:uncharacterized protein G647_00418 [Cladophialophora carrionii CBS 160.54]ETI27969.1 hypothetical protein G647_00418 [Cladophialophora carrionii CBS 160.54]
MGSSQVDPGWLPPDNKAEAIEAGVIKEGMSYEDRLFHYTYATRYDELHFLEWRLLQRINIFNLQNKLARLKGTYWTKQQVSNSESDELRSTLHQYGEYPADPKGPASSEPYSNKLLVTAIKDYAFMQTLCELPESRSYERQRDLAMAFPGIADLDGAPYNSRYCTLAAPPPLIPSDPIRQTLNRFLPKRLTYTKLEMEANFDDFLAGKPPSTISPFVDKMTRFIVAFTGGASLVVPMLIMSLPSTNQTKSLTTVSVAVTLFALLLSMGVRTDNSNTLVATATYAAVLVVFVGTSS